MYRQHLLFLEQTTIESSSPTVHSYERHDSYRFIQMTRVALILLPYSENIRKLR